MVKILDHNFVTMTQAQYALTDIVPTLTTNRTLFNSAGLLVHAPANECLRSEEFNSGSWSTVRITVSANVVGIDAPNGTETADGFISSADNNNHRVQQQKSIQGGQRYTWSCFVRAAARTIVYVLTSGGVPNTTRTTYFDLAAVSVGTTGTEHTNATITNEGDSWRRISVSYTPPEDENDFFCVCPAEADNDAVFAGDGSTIDNYSWGAMLNRGDLIDYIPTAGTAVFLPRLGSHVFEDPAWIPKGLGDWQATANEAIQSEDRATSHTNGSDTVINTNTAIAPDGQLTSDRIIDDSGGGTSANVSSGLTLTLAASGDHTYYEFVEADGLSECALETAGFDAGGNGTSFFDLTGNGAVNTEHANHTARIENVSGGRYLVSVTFSTTTDLTGTCLLYPVQTTDSLIVDLDGTSSIFGWGTMITASDIPLPYAATFTVAFSVSADIHNQLVSTINGFSQLQGTLYALAEIPFISVPQQVILQLDDGSNTDRMIVASFNSRSILPEELLTKLPVRTTSQTAVIAAARAMLNMPTTSPTTLTPSTVPVVMTTLYDFPIS